jgi:pyruvate,orthophosphate dikinase
MAIEMAEEPDFPLSHEQPVQRVLPLLANPPRSFIFDETPAAPMVVGLPASPGVASGAIVLSASAAQSAGRPVILVRAETSPEDVAGMAKSAGVLTARGGLASHAAVVARGWGIPAVVGATDVYPADDHVILAGRRLSTGDVITIDGSTGSVYLGEVAGHWEEAPEVATLLVWAHELDIDVAGDSPTRASAATGTTSRTDALVCLAIKGVTPPEKLAEALLADTHQLQPILEDLTSEGLAEQSDDGWKLSAEGKAAAAAVVAGNRADVADPEKRLDEFHALDGRMKEIVTAWQLRDVDGQQTFNDHSDPTYDQAVLDRLGSLHEETDGWLAPLGATLPRLELYRSRLDRALAAARTGDQRFVASPRVDSYHSVWFELHEDLIRLAGKTRSE